MLAQDVPELLRKFLLNLLIRRVCRQVAHVIRIHTQIVQLFSRPLAKAKSKRCPDLLIGSNTALVAPVEVGPGATIGAGSVITRAAPADKLTLARGRQVTIENWQRPVKKLKPS